MSDEQIVPFTVEIGDREITDLRSGIRNTRWPEQETVDGWQGTLEAFAQDLAADWVDESDGTRWLARGGPPRRCAVANLLCPYRAGRVLRVRERDVATLRALGAEWVPDLRRYSEIDQSGHFASLEAPDLFIDEARGGIPRDPRRQRSGPPEVRPSLRIANISDAPTSAEETLELHIMTIDLHLTRGVVLEEKPGCHRFRLGYPRTGNGAECRS